MGILSTPTRATKYATQLLLGLLAIPNRGKNTCYIAVVGYTGYQPEPLTYATYIAVVRDIGYAKLGHGHMLHNGWAYWLPQPQVMDICYTAIVRATGYIQLGHGNMLHSCGWVHWLHQPTMMYVPQCLSKQLTMLVEHFPLGKIAFRPKLRSIGVELA